MADWAPIRTAPKDGRDLLGVRDTNGRQLVIRWDRDTAQWQACNTVTVRPTHWQPLPAYPTPPPAPEDT